MRLSFPALSLALCLGMAAQPATAATHLLDLSFDMSGFFSGSIGPFAFGQVASGAFSPFVVAAGDTIAFDLTITGPVPGFSVPGGTAQFLGINFLGDADPTGASTSGTFLGLAGGSGDLPAFPASVGCGNCLHAIFGRPSGGAFAFSGLSGFLSIDTLADSFTVSTITLSYQVTPGAAGAIPEPHSWAMMVVGFALAGAALRRRVRTAAA